MIFMEDTTGFLPGPRAGDAAASSRPGRAMLDAIIDLRTPRILLIIRNAFGGAYAAYNCYATGADVVLALPTTRLAVMGAGRQGVRVQGRDPQARDQEARRSSAHGGRAGRPRRGARASGRGHEAELNQRYERELMNPREALSLGSISEIVMPTDLRACSASTCDFLLRHYEPGPMGGPQREFH